MNRILLATTFFFTVAGSALAADAVVFETTPEVAVVTGYNWTGAYIGLHGGYAWTDGEYSEGGDSASDDFDGGLFGAHAGYNWQGASNFVAGVEVDIEHVWNEHDFDAGGGDVEIETGLQGSARLRAGYAMDRTLFYITGGVAATNFSVESPDGDVDEDETFVGWTAGVGVEHAFADNWTGRVEYRFADFGSEEVAGTDVDLEQHTVRVGISYKF